MIKKPENFDSVVAELKENERFELGGHTCVIMDAEPYHNEETGKDSLKVYFDTDRHDKQPMYFTRMFKNDTKEDKKWSNIAIKYIPLGTSKTQIEMLNNFKTSVENSNTGYKFNWDESTLKDKRVVCVFGLEEYKKQDGSTGFKTVIKNFRSIDKLDKIKIPKVKLLNGTSIEYEEYLKTRNNTQTQSTTTNINSSELPF